MVELNGEIIDWSLPERTCYFQKIVWQDHKIKKNMKREERIVKAVKKISAQPKKSLLVSNFAVILQNIIS